jgi:hypothetical protein
VPYVIAAACIDEGGRELYIHPGECIDFGAPPGNAGGAAATGPLGVDTELVAQWDKA